MANPKDEFDRQQQALAATTAPAGQAKSLAASTDPANASRFAKLPPGIGGNAAAPSPAPAMSANSIVQTAGSLGQGVPAAPVMPTPTAATLSVPTTAGLNTLASSALPKSQQISNSMLMGPPSTQREAAQQGQLWRQAQSAEMNERYDSAGAQMASEARAAATQRMSRAANRPIAAAVAPVSSGAAALSAYDSAHPMVAAPSPGAALAPGAAPLPEGVTPSSAGAGRGSINPPLADPSKPVPTILSTAPAAANPMTNFDRTGMSNAQVAEANPAGRVTMTRQPNGTMSFSGGDVSGPVSYMNSAGNPLVGGGLRGNGFSRVDSAPAGAGVAMDGAGNYAFSSNPIAAGAGGTAQGGAGPAGAGASSSASSAVNAAVAAAAQRGDWDAVGAHYAGRGQNFGGQTAAQIQQAQAGPQGATIGGSTFGFDPQARNAQFDRDQLTRTIMDPNTKRSMRSALVSMDQTSSQSQSNAQRLASEERRSAANNDASMEQVAMRERGEDFRAANRNQLAAAELNQRYRDSDAQNQIRNLEAARAQRTAGILERYDAAKSEGERMALIRQHPDVFGQKTVQGKDRYVTVGGGTSVVDGQTVREPTSLFDTVTQQYVRGADKALPPVESNKQALAIRDNPKLSWDQKFSELQKLGYFREN